MTRNVTTDEIVYAFNEHQIALVSHSWASRRSGQKCGCALVALVWASGHDPYEVMFEHAGTLHEPVWVDGVKMDTITAAMAATADIDPVVAQGVLLGWDNAAYTQGDTEHLYGLFTLSLPKNVPETVRDRFIWGWVAGRDAFYRTMKQQVK